MCCVDSAQRLNPLCTARSSTKVLSVRLPLNGVYTKDLKQFFLNISYPRRARSALGVDTVLTLDVCMYVCMYVRALERKRLIGMT